MGSRGIEVGCDVLSQDAAQVVLAASAFDQRTVRELGATRITATETIETEEGRREAEVLALKEAGRLLAVYFGPRILASGR